MRVSGMRARLRKALFVLSAGVIAAGAVAFVAPGAASAENIFDRFFGDLRRAIEHPAPARSAYSDPFSSLARAVDPPPASSSEATGASRGFCVRTCDGRYFPVQASGSVSAADMCHAFCPAAETKIYGGSNIDYATARDGSRYVDLDNAYVYRQRMVQGCTCNGRDAYGLAHINVAEDPTLKPGDVVVTRSGLVAYNGSKNKTAEFTPVRSYSGFSKNYRQMLSELKLMQPNPGAPADIASSLGAANDERSVQLRR